MPDRSTQPWILRWLHQQPSTDAAGSSNNSLTVRPARPGTSPDEDLSAGGRDSAKDTFNMERTAAVAIALGVTERCFESCTRYAKERVQFEPIGEFQLKPAKMGVARLNMQNLVFRQLEMAQASSGKGSEAWPAAGRWSPT